MWGWGDLVSKNKTSSHKSKFNVILDFKPEKHLWTWPANLNFIFI